MPNKILEYARQTIDQARGMSVWAILSLVGCAIIFLTLIIAGTETFYGNKLEGGLFLFLALFTTIAGWLGLRDADRENRVLINYLFCSLGLFTGGKLILWGSFWFINNFLLYQYSSQENVMLPIGSALLPYFIVFLLIKIALRHKQLAWHRSWIIVLSIIILQTIIMLGFNPFRYLLYLIAIVFPLRIMYAAVIWGDALSIIILGLVGLNMGIWGVIEVRKNKPPGNWLAIVFGQIIILFICFLNIYFTFGFAGWFSIHYPLVASTISHSIQLLFDVSPQYLPW